MKTKGANLKQSRGKLPSPGLRLVLADDHVLMRDLLATMLGQAEGYTVVAEISTAEQAIEVCRKHKPDLIVLDVNMPGMSGIEAIPTIKETSPTTRVLVCCSTVTKRELVTALGAGADGFMEKSNSRVDFLEAITRVSRGETYLCKKCVSLLSTALRNPAATDPQGLDQLTPREREVLTLIANGRSSKEIAAQLFLSVTTVDTHRANFMAKISAHNVAQVIRYALEHGLVDAPTAH